MKLQSLLVLATSATLARAHATVQAVWLNGVDQGQGDDQNGYIRYPPNNSPVVAISSTDMTCNKNNGPVARTLQVEAGDKFEFEWRHQSRTPGDQIIDPSHKGPVLVYIAPTTQGAAGSNWVKLYEDGYTNGQWAVERLRANAGRHAITIPDIVPGTYLLRAEIIALHEAYYGGGAQFYMECVQIQVTSSGSKVLPAGVSMPGAYRADDPGVKFDLYNGFTSYTIPGPPVWDGASNPNPSSPQVASSTSSTRTSETTAAPNPPPSTFRTSSISSSSSSRPPPPPPPSTPSSSSPSPAAPSSSNTDPTRAYIYQQCGGTNWAGPQGCYEGLICTEQNPYYSQCLSGPGPRPASIWEQCGGEGWGGARTCHPGLECRGDRWYGQCVPPQ